MALENATAGVRIVEKKTLEQAITKFTLAILVGWFQEQAALVLTCSTTLPP